MCGPTNKAYRAVVRDVNLTFSRFSSSGNSVRTQRVFQFIRKFISWLLTICGREGLHAGIGIEVTKIRDWGIVREAFYDLVNVNRSLNRHFTVIDIKRVARVIGSLM